MSFRILVEADAGRVLTALSAAEPTESPAPDPGSGLDTSSTAVTAGLGGFFVLFGLGLVLWFISRDMFKRIRRINNTEEERRRELAATASSSGDDGPARGNSDDRGDGYGSIARQGTGTAEPGEDLPDPDDRRDPLA